MASRGKGAKAKGAQFERRVAKIFTAWWNSSGLAGEFYRTPASGGLRWQNRSDVVGDLCTPEGFTATIECKNQEQWDFRELFKECVCSEPTSSARNITGFWWQAREEASRAGRQPLLVFTRNHYDVYVMFPVKITHGSTEYNRLGVVKRFVFESGSIVAYEDVFIMPLSSFLEVTPPKFFYNPVRGSE